MILSTTLRSSSDCVRGFALELPRREDQTSHDTREDLVVAADTLCRCMAIAEGREDARGRRPWPPAAPPALPDDAVWDIFLTR